MSYVRFVIAINDPDSGRRQGLFQALAELRRESRLLPEETTAYEEHYQWFCKNLRKPKKLAVSTHPHAASLAISWFKDSANEHIRRMRVLADILDAHGLRTEMIQTEKPGYIVYEDAFQVAAEPFSDTNA